MDEHSSPVWTILRRRSVAELVDASNNAAKLIVARTGNREANLRRVVGLPCSDLATEGIVAITGCEPSDICYIERDQARGGYYAPFVVVVPGRRRTVGPGFRNFMTAVPRRGRDLPGEVFERRTLALFVVCHAVSGNSIPYSINERLGAGFRNFATSVGKRDVAGRLAGDRRGRLLVEVGYRADPGIGSKFVVVEVEFPVLVADGGDKACLRAREDTRPYRYGIECSHCTERVRPTICRALGADSLDDVGERRIDIVGSLALDAIERLHDRARTCIDWRHRVGRIDRRVVVGRCLRHHVRTGTGFGDHAVDVVVGVLDEQARLTLLGLDLSLTIAGGVVCPFGGVGHTVEPLDFVGHRKAPGLPLVVVLGVLQPLAMRRHIRGHDLCFALVCDMPFPQFLRTRRPRERPLPHRIVENIPQCFPSALLHRDNGALPVVLAPDGKPFGRLSRRNSIESRLRILRRGLLQGVDRNVVPREARRVRDIGKTRRREILAHPVRVVDDIYAHVCGRSRYAARIGYGDELPKSASHVGCEESASRTVAEVQVVVHGIAGRRPPFRIDHHESLVHLDVYARIGPSERLAFGEDKMDRLSVRMREHDLRRGCAVRKVLRAEPLERVPAKDGVKRVRREYRRRIVVGEYLQRTFKRASPRRCLSQINGSLDALCRNLLFRTPAFVPRTAARGRRIPRQFPACQRLAAAKRDRHRGESRLAESGNG